MRTDEHKTDTAQPLPINQLDLDRIIHLVSTGHEMHEVETMIGIEHGSLMKLIAADGDVLLRFALALVESGNILLRQSRDVFANGPGLEHSQGRGAKGTAQKIWAGQAEALLEGGKAKIALGLALVRKVNGVSKRAQAGRRAVLERQRQERAAAGRTEAPWSSTAVAQRLSQQTADAFYESLPQRPGTSGFGVLESIGKRLSERYGTTPDQPSATAKATQRTASKATTNDTANDPIPLPDVGDQWSADALQRLIDWCDREITRRMRVDNTTDDVQDTRDRAARALVKLRGLS